jgi:hypothetical protein
LVCPCGGWEECDCHTCCGDCPDNGEFWCGECWGRDCYDHNIRDLVELLADLKGEGRPRGELEPIIKYTDAWRRKFAKNQN